MPKGTSYTKKVLSGFALVFIAMALTNIAGYVLRLVLARSLTPTEYGLLYSILALFGITTVFQTLGLQDALTQGLPKLRKSQYKSALLTVIYAQLCVTAVLAVIFILSRDWLAAAYFKNPLASSLLVIFALSVLISPIEASLIGFILGTGRVSWYGYFSLLRAIVLLIITYLLLQLGLGIYAPMLGYVLMFLIIPLVYLPVLHRIVPEYRTMPGQFDLALLRKFFTIGVPIMFSFAIGTMLTSIDTFFITLYRTLPEVGMYNVALPTASLLWFISSIIYIVMLPISSEMNAKRKIVALQESVSKMYVYLLLAVLPFATVLLIYPDIIINALFGGQYLAAAATLQVLVVAGVVYTFSSLNASIITGLGKPKMATLSLGVAATINVILDILLIPTYGIIGSAFATLVAFIVLLFMNLRALSKLITFRLEYGRMAKVVLVTMVFGAVTVYLRHALSLPLWWKVIASIVIAGAVYVALLFVLRIVQKEDLAILRR